MPYQDEQIELIGTITYAAEAWLQGAGFRLLNCEQNECLEDPARAAEALGMMQDLRDRVGLPEKFVAPLAPIFLAAMREQVEDNAHDFHALLDLQREWIGHDDFDANDQPEDIARLLREWITEVAA
jgi:hypothetical protein